MPRREAFLVGAFAVGPFLAAVAVVLVALIRGAFGVESFVLLWVVPTVSALISGLRTGRSGLTIVIAAIASAGMTLCAFVLLLFLILLAADPFE